MSNKFLKKKHLPNDNEKKQMFVNKNIINEFKDIKQNNKPKIDDFIIVEEVKVPKKPKKIIKKKLKNDINRKENIVENNHNVLKTSVNFNKTEIINEKKEKQAQPKNMITEEINGLSLEQLMQRKKIKRIRQEFENKIKSLEETIHKMAYQLENSIYRGGGMGGGKSASSKTDTFISKTQIGIPSTESRDYNILPLNTFRVAELRVSTYNQTQEYYYSFIIKGIKILNTNTVNDIVYSKVGSMNITASVVIVNNQVVLQIQNNENFDIFVDIISEI